MVLILENEQEAVGRRKVGFCIDELEGACSQNEKIIRRVITHGPLGLPWIISQRECESNARASVLLSQMFLCYFVQL